MSAPTRVLAALVATEVIEFKIAILRPSPGASTARIFHDKLGILRDAQGAVVIFKGSMNETWSGLAGDGNLESVDVACSWLGGRDQERTTEETTYFEALWTNSYPGLDVRPFPATARAELVSAADTDWETTVEHLLRDRSRTSSTLDELENGCSDADAQASSGCRSRGMAYQRAPRHSCVRDRVREDFHCPRCYSRVPQEVR